MKIVKLGKFEEKGLVCVRAAGTPVLVMYSPYKNRFRANAPGLFLVVEVDGNNPEAALNELCDMAVYAAQEIVEEAESDFPHLDYRDRVVLETIRRYGGPERWAKRFRREAFLKLNARLRRSQRRTALQIVEEAETATSSEKPVGAGGKEATDMTDMEQADGTYDGHDTDLDLAAITDALRVRIALEAEDLLEIPPGYEAQYTSVGADHLAIYQMDGPWMARHRELAVDSGYCATKEVALDRLRSRLTELGAALSGMDPSGHRADEIAFVHARVEEHRSVEAWVEALIQALDQ